MTKHREPSFLLSARGGREQDRVRAAAATPPGKAGSPRSCQHKLVARRVQFPVFDTRHPSANPYSVPGDTASTTATARHLQPVAGRTSRGDRPAHPFIVQLSRS